MYRTEKDTLGEKQIPANSLYGIHALRAKENFPGNTHFPIEWYKAVGATKHACYLTYRKFRDAAVNKQKSLYVCFNRSLADHMRKIATPRSIVTNFHELCI